ncbi:hypothetical protein Syun_012261 [Stephania yunnanensis]|uniref:Protein kinase domain-containing protein n=1 Tax=Stephania yunnanensis TaxID=152371 RepID=A0AAP0JZB4_9MAGN
MFSQIFDFGLAKMMPENQEMYVTTKVLDTFKYFDPEYTSTGKLMIQSDVYTFGVVLLELDLGEEARDLSQGPNDQNLVLQVQFNILSGDSPRSGMGKEARKILEHALGNHAKARSMDGPWCRPPRADGTRMDRAPASTQGA